MVLEFFKRSGESTLDQVDQQLVQMLVEGRHIFDAAMNALLGGTDPKAIKKDLRSTDRGINEMEQAIRRDLVVHSTVQPSTDISLVLGYMSIVKDAERIGDYAKNIFDLRRYGADFSEASDRKELIRYRDLVSSLIGETAAIFTSGDPEAAQERIDSADDLLDEYDAHVKAAFEHQGPAAEAVPRALLFRYLKRITAHLTNMLSLLVMPLDRLDYYDEAKDTRD